MSRNNITGGRPTAIGVIEHLGPHRLEDLKMGADGTSHGGAPVEQPPRGSGRAPWAFSAVLGFPDAWEDAQARAERARG